jgi:hypothetical protein
MNAHIFLRPPSKSELEILSNENPSKITIYSLSIYNEYFNSIPYTLIDFDSVKKKVNFEFFEKVISFGEIEIERVAIADRLTIDGQSFWHYHKFRCYFQARELLYEMQVIKSLMGKHTHIELYTNKSGLSEGMLDALLSVKVINTTNKHNKNNKNYSSQFKFILFIAIRFVKGVFSSKPLGKHIIIDKGIKQLCLNPNTLEVGLENIFFENIFRAANKNITIVSDTEIPPLGSEFNLRKKIFANPKRSNYSFPGEYVLARGLFSIGVWRETLAAKKLLKKQVDFISKNVTDSSEKLIVNFLSAHSHSSLVYAFKHKAWRRFLKKWPTLSITSVDENSPMVMSIMDAARFHNITCVGVQHGSIHNLHPAYIHSKADAVRNIFPDLTLVWGNYWKNFLVNVANYPSARVLVTGQQRTDAIPVLLKNIEKINQLFGFQNKKIVLFASQPQQDASLRYRAAQDIFNAAKEHKQLLFVVKLHPSEMNDSQYYHSIANDIGCSNYQIDINSDLYALLAVSAIVITCFSTVGSEALYFKKPIIILDHLKADLLGLIGRNLAIRATNAEELTVAINNIICGHEAIATNEIETYINEYAFKIDGLAAQRILNTINGIVN